MTSTQSGRSLRRVARAPYCLNKSVIARCLSCPGYIPDIFVTGHVHGQYVGDHKGTTIVHSSTWQDQTDYQRMLGFQPKPCILTVINLHTHASASIPFA